MSEPDLPAQAQRILVVAPLGEDAPLTCELLGQAGLICQSCPDLAALLGEMAQGVGVLLLTEEALWSSDLEQLCEALDTQPLWSALPVIVFTEAHPTEPKTLAPLRALEARRGVSFLERPVSLMNLISTLQVALEGRRRQYQVRDLLRAGEEGMRYRDEFLAMLGHELRNPLAPIRSAVDLLRLSDNPEPEQLDWGLGMIDRQLHHLRGLIDDLLDVARVTQGRITLQKTLVGLMDIIAPAVETVRPLIDERRHQLHLHLPAHPLQVEGDVIRLTQVLINLLGNAAKYTDPGGRIDLTAGVEDGQLVLIVRDNGSGIPTDLLPHLFDLFTQGKQSLDRSRGGLGVGLPLVRRLSEMHGGRVAAFSAGEGQGSEFRVYLPVVDSPSACPLQAGSPSQPVTPPHHRRILVVDDQPEVAQALVRLLHALGYETASAADGQGALAAVAQFQPTDLFLDIGLPDLDGYEVARRLRQQHGHPRPRLIALTGYGQPEDRQKGQQAGFDAYLVKPASLEDIQRMLEASDPE